MFSFLFYLLILSVNKYTEDMKLSAERTEQVLPPLPMSLSNHLGFRWRQSCCYSTCRRTATCVNSGEDGRICEVILNVAFLPVFWAFDVYRRNRPLLSKEFRDNGDMYSVVFLDGSTHDLLLAYVAFFYCLLYSSPTHSWVMDYAVRDFV